jgi:hypothetical protein
MHRAIHDFVMHCLNEILVGEIKVNVDPELKGEGEKGTDHDFAMPLQVKSHTKRQISPLRKIFGI